MNLEHVAINVTDPEASSAWWQEHLGTTIVRAQKVDAKMHFVHDEQGSMVEMYSNPAGPVLDFANVNSFSLHFAFASDDIEADLARLVAAGAVAEGEITITPTNEKLAFLRDPWDVPLQLVQRPEPLV